MPQKVLITFLTMFFVWIMLSGFSLGEIILGSLVSIVVALVSSKEFIKGSVKPKFHPRRWVFFFVYVMVFLVAEIYSHLDLAFSILTGKTNPKVFALKSKFKNPAYLTTIGNSITLTPGTLTLDIKGKKIITYCLNEKSKNIIKVFEAFLESVFR